MCKKLLSGLLGGGSQEQKVPAAAPTAAVNPDNQSTVKADIISPTTRSSSMLAPVSEDRKRKGVPGLSL